VVGPSGEHPRQARTEPPFAVLVGEDAEHRTNGVAKKFAELKIKKAMVVTDEDCLLQNSARVAHGHALASSQVFQVRRLHTATAWNTD
jgi:hypothetical protein